MAITEAVAEVTLRLRVEAAIIPPPAVVVIAIRRRGAGGVAAATALPHRVAVEATVLVVAVAIVPAEATEAEDVKLTYNRGRRQAPQLNPPPPLPSF